MSLQSITTLWVRGDIEVSLNRLDNEPVTTCVGLYLGSPGGSSEVSFHVNEEHRAALVKAFRVAADVLESRTEFPPEVEAVNA